MLTLLAGALSLSPSSRAEMGRRTVLGGAAAFISVPLGSRADTSVPTFTLKGIPGLTALTGADAPRPGDLGVIGKGADGSKSGRLQFCDKKGCITSFGSPDDDGYVPPWTYAPEEMRVTSANDARRAALRAQLAAEGGATPVAKERKSIETAQDEMRTMLQAFEGCTIVKDEPRCAFLR